LCTRTCMCLYVCVSMYVHVCVCVNTYGCVLHTVVSLLDINLSRGEF
jgi:hypothetical protein